jgi:hypothetical protein
MDNEDIKVPRYGITITFLDNEKHEEVRFCTATC